MLAKRSKRKGEKKKLKERFKNKAGLAKYQGLPLNSNRLSWAFPDKSLDPITNRSETKNPRKNGLKANLKKPKNGGKKLKKLTYEKLFLSLSTPRLLTAFCEEVK